MRQRAKIIALVVGVMAFLLVAAGASLWWLLRTESGIKQGATWLLGKRATSTETVALAPELLGFNQPRTIMLLFLNNTEMRPAGGFIGSYGLLTLDKGQVVSFSTNGSENLDNVAPTTFLVAPPAPIHDYLGQKFWYFRDANWSPDFADAARHALQFYSAEQGVGADKINTVIGLTPAVVETLLKYTGPITIGDTTYSAESITDLLEYQVEIAYLNKQIPFSERKAVIQHLGTALAKKIALISPTKWGALVDDIFGLLAQGQIMAYDVNPSVQTALEKQGWAGRLLPGNPDKLMVVDANLASLKTDRVMERAVDYSLSRSATGTWEGVITLHYKNTGHFDWRTSRYRTYTRIYLPSNTKFLGGTGVMKKDRSPEVGQWDVTEEDGHTVIGAFWVIEPSEEKVLQVRVALAPAVVQAITAGQYGLLTQKQLGLPEFQLTINHNFGKNVRRATPAEAPNNFGDQEYTWSGTVTRDQTFYVES